MKSSRQTISILLICVILVACGDEDNPSPSLPSAPTNLKASIGNHSVILDWDPVSSANSYNLYFSQTPGITPATAQKILSISRPYTHEGLENISTLHYVVTAVDANGESPPSQEISVTPAHIVLETTTSNTTSDNGTFTMLGSVKNVGSVPACDISPIASVNARNGLQTAHASLVGQTLKYSGVSTNTCLRPGETGFYQIFTAAPSHLVIDYSIEITAAADGIEVPTLTPDDLPATAAWNAGSQKFEGTVTNLSQADPAYAVSLNLITFNSSGKVAGIYSSYVSGNECTELGFSDTTCIPPAGAASFSISPWRSVPLPTDVNHPFYIKMDDLVLIVTHFEATDFVSAPTP